MVTFNPRTTPPTPYDMYYVSTSYGGLNQCIIRNYNNGFVLPNCVGYAWGRFMEEQGFTSCNLSRGNATDWYGYNDGYARGNTARLGAVVCYGGGYGHVCIVEGINADGSIQCSESNYSGGIFQMRTIPNDYNIGVYGLYFQGFIYPPTNFDTGGDDTPIPPPQPPIHNSPFKWWYYRYLLERRNNGKL